jgi:hypothetical protein
VYRHALEYEAQQKVLCTMYVAYGRQHDISEN